MDPRRRRQSLLLLIPLLILIPFSLGAIELRSVTVGFTEAWTGNGYKPDLSDPGGVYDFQVTGSEALPIDPFLILGARLSLIDSLFLESGSLTVTPTAQIGFRHYLLYENGRVVPTQVETALGDDENNEPGLGSARVMTIRLAWPVSYELGFPGGSAAILGFSPTLLVRVRAGDLAYRTDRSDLAGMYGFFYGAMRFLMPEIHAGFRFPVSDFLQICISGDYGVSVFDLADATLPFYEQMRVQLGITAELIPPFSGLFRNTAR
ncbi:MAG: hypothetical protein E4H09_02825 [Spirochaetales bacterium]|nr:MAG: hypothetical protein E4H09_02825 [Spirochaetales bacterium]